VSPTVLEADQEISQFHETTAPCVRDARIDDPRESRELGTMNQHGAIDREPPDLLNRHQSIDDPAHMIGLFEKSSEDQWLQAIAMTQSQPTVEEADGLCQRQRPYAATNEQVSSYNFWTDNGSVEFELSVGPHALPPLETAERLLSC
jgi:hypothetical protein